MLPAPEQIQIVFPVMSCILLVLSLKRSIFGVIAYFIILNAKLGDMYPVLGAIRFEFVAAIIVILSIVLQAHGLQNVLPSKNSLNKKLWIYFALGMLSVPLAVDATASWANGGYTLFKLMLFYIMVVASVHNSDDLTKIVWGMILVTSWIAYEPLFNYITGRVVESGYGDIAYGRFGVATGHVALANTLAQGLPLTYYWAISQRSKALKIAAFSFILLLVIGIVISKSRGGFVALAAVATGITYLSKDRFRTMAILAAAFILLLPIAGRDYINRVSTIREGVFQSRSTSDRYLGLVHGISMMIKRPVLGVGIGAYAEARRKYFSYYFYSHNLYGELFGELGLASLSWFLWIYLIFKRTGQLKKLVSGKDDPDAIKYYNLLCAVQVGLFTRLVIGNFSHCQLIWFWFLMAGLTIGIENIVVTRKVSATASEPLPQSTQISSVTQIHRV